MDDVQFVAILSNLISYIDERFGRIAAWVFGLFIISSSIAVLVLFTMWMIG